MFHFFLPNYFWRISIDDISIHVVLNITYIYYTFIVFIRKKINWKISTHYAIYQVIEHGRIKYLIKFRNISGARRLVQELFFQKWPLTKHSRKSPHLIWISPMACFHSSPIQAWEVLRCSGSPLINMLSLEHFRKLAKTTQASRFPGILTAV